jgi:hypothetical protein
MYKHVIKPVGKKDTSDKSFKNISELKYLGKKNK